MGQGCLEWPSKLIVVSGAEEHDAGLNALVRVSHPWQQERTANGSNRAGLVCVHQPLQCTDSHAAGSCSCGRLPGYCAIEAWQPMLLSGCT